MMTKRYPFYIGITTLIVGIVLILTGLFVWISHRESRIAAIQMADRLFSEINEKVLERYEKALESVAVLAGSAARMPGMASPPVGGGLSHPGMELMLEALAFYDYLFSTYIGYDNGGFLQLIAVRNDPDYLRIFNAPEGTYYLLRSISEDVDGNRIQRWHFLNRDRKVTGQRPDLDPDYDPRNRPWYRRALREDSAFFTDPYVFSATRVPGITCAARLVGGQAVFGADITLDRFSTSLRRQKVSENGRLFMFDRQGRVIAHPTIDPVKAGTDGSLKFMTTGAIGDPMVQFIVDRWRADPQGMLNRTLELRIQGEDYLVRLTGMEEALKFTQILASLAPVSDFTAHIRRMQQRVFFFSCLVLLLVLPMALIVSRRISRSLVQLERESVKIRQRDFSPSPAFDSSIKEIHSLIKAFRLMKRTIRTLLEQQRKLFDDFTKLIAGAIDAKSPYTGGHCARVPVVAQMLADAARQAEAGPFADFAMDTDDQRWEFEVAAWLHDCGKVTTPEYVVDKATKLETIYNRIHEIRMRFEVLIRDAQIDMYEGLLKGDSDPAVLKGRFEKAKRQIIDDFAFVADCNVGGEFMDDEQIERLRRIAQRNWIRHLDDRIGISADEAALKGRFPAPALPVVEQVLADKPEHIVPRSGDAPFDAHSHGFNMAVPEDQYNLGELYNLSIRKGTLSPEDRFKINEHIVQTIIMLDTLEFPDYLAHVAEYAGAHHETMIGTGYPRGLKKKDMSVPARILAIADIFEALTAADRPYKQPKKLSQALRIMSLMRDDQHIDPDLFDLFLKSGVYQRYAEQHMDAALIDAVTIETYLSPGNE